MNVIETSILNRPVSPTTLLLFIRVLFPIGIKAHCDDAKVNTRINEVLSFLQKVEVVLGLSGERGND